MLAQVYTIKIYEHSSPMLLAFNVKTFIDGR